MTPTHPTRFEFAALSHRGRVRGNNEDRLAVQEFCLDDPHTPVLMAALCDGVGGHLAGEVAAQIGVDTVMQAVRLWPSLQNPVESLEQAVAAANQAILEAHHQWVELEGMAATCVCALIIGDALYVANLGDSRAYLLRSGKMNQLTRDHTWLQERLGAGMRSGRPGREHPLAHALSRYLGAPHPPQVDTRVRALENSRSGETADPALAIQAGDQLLLCSDGLTDSLSDAEISSLIAGSSPRKDAQRLIHCALEKGGHDNISVIVVYL